MAIESSDVLSLGFGEFVSGDIVDTELVLLENVLALGSVDKIIEAEIHAVVVIRNSVQETSILEKVSTVDCARGSHLQASSGAG